MRYIMSGLILPDIDSATMSEFSSIASLRSAQPESCAWRCNKRLQEVCVIISNVAVNFFSADAFLDELLGSSQGPYRQLAILSALLFFSVGTVISNYFAKLSFLHSPVSGLELSKKDYQTYQDLEYFFIQFFYNKTCNE